MKAGGSGGDKFEKDVESIEKALKELAKSPEGTVPVPSSAPPDSRPTSPDGVIMNERKSKKGPPSETPPAPPAEPKKSPPKDGPPGDGEVKKPIKEQPKIEQPKAPDLGRKVIYTAELEFEVQSFDESLDIIRLLKGATSVIGTINKDKLPNGKMRGVIVLRVLPDQLEGVVGKLIKELVKKGELKNQHLFSEDVTKHYTDLESRLKASRAMEERLIAIIKDGKGVIKDLLAAEKELGIWRTKIEETEGELRYYANLVSYSTLTIKLYEKDIRNAAQVTEFERVQAGIETEDVEMAYNKLKTLAEAKGRVTRSELKNVAAGQFNAMLHFEVPQKLAPEVPRSAQAAGHPGPFSDRHGAAGRRRRHAKQEGQGGLRRHAVHGVDLQPGQHDPSRNRHPAPGRGGCPQGVQQAARPDPHREGPGDQRPAQRTGTLRHHGPARLRRAASSATRRSRICSTRAARR